MTTTLPTRADVIAYAREQIVRIIAESMSAPPDEYGRSGIEAYWSQHGTSYMTMWTQIVLAMKED